MNINNLLNYWTRSPYFLYGGSLGCGHYISIYYDTNGKEYLLYFKNGCGYTDDASYYGDLDFRTSDWFEMKRRVNDFFDKIMPKNNENIVEQND